LELPPEALTFSPNAIANGRNGLVLLTAKAARQLSIDPKLACDPSSGPAAGV
jgi:hypothetical protein